MEPTFIKEWLPVFVIGAVTVMIYMLFRILSTRVIRFILNKLPDDADQNIATARFTDRVIQRLNEKKEPVVFILWSRQPPLMCPGSKPLYSMSWRAVSLLHSIGSGTIPGMVESLFFSFSIFGIAFNNPIV